MTTRRTYPHVGWSLGNYCPFRCAHCYSEWVRQSDKSLPREQIDSICEELAAVGVRHVTLGGNEPFFTNGPHVADSQLGYIIRTLLAHGMRSHVVSSGPSVTLLAKTDPEAFGALASVNLSIDSPFPEEHDRNRGASLFDQVQRAAEVTQQRGIRLLFLYCAMDWNFDGSRIEAFLELTRQWSALPRVNAAKPIVKNGLLTRLLGSEQFWSGFDLLTRLCATQVVTEPPLRRALGLDAVAPCCGDTTFRISSLSGDGALTISGCTYVHSGRLGPVTEGSLRAFVDELREPGCEDCVARENRKGWLPGADAGMASIPDWRERRRVASQLGGAFENYLCTWIGST